MSIYQVIGIGMLFGLAGYGVWLTIQDIGLRDTFEVLFLSIGVTAAIIVALALAMGQLP